MEEKMKLAADSYDQGYTCSQAVFCAYADEISMDKETAYRIMEGFGGGIGGMQEVCGAFSAAAGVISYLCSDGNTESGKSKVQTYKLIRKAADIFQKEYDGITCRDILRGESPKAFQCGMKVKDAVLLVEQMRKEMGK